VVAVEDAWGIRLVETYFAGALRRTRQALTIGELIEGAVHLPEPVEVQPR